jgi:hypothetical protein
MTSVTLPFSFISFVWLQLIQEINTSLVNFLRWYSKSIPATLKRP